MVVKSRARAILVPLVFYAVFGGASAYLVKNASEGKHGAVARAKFDKQSTTLAAELADLQDERERWVHRVNALRNESIDRDLLEQEARGLLDRVGKDDVVIFTDTPKR